MRHEDGRERARRRKYAQRKAVDWAIFYGRQKELERRRQYDRTLRLLRERLEARRKGDERVLRP